MTDLESGRVFYSSDVGNFLESETEEKMTFNQVVDLMIGESIQVAAIPKSHLISDREAEKEFKSGGGKVRSFGKYRIFSMPGAETIEITKMEKFIEEKVKEGERMPEVEYLLRRLKEDPPEYVKEFGREDPIIDIIEYLLFAKKEKVSVLARKFGVESKGALSIYYRCGSPFTKHGFENEEEWPITYDQETESFAIQHFDVIRKFFKRIAVPEDFHIDIILPKTEERKSYSGEDLIRISLEDTKEFSDIIYQYFSQVPCDQIGRPCVEIKSLKRGRFLLLGSFWLFSLIVKAGYRSKGREGLVDERTVSEAFSQLTTRGRQERFIDDDKTFPIVISSDFNDDARELAECLQPPAILLPVEQFIRLIDFIEGLSSLREKEVAFWGLFRLGKIREADPSRRIDSFIDETRQAISILEEEVNL